MSKRMPFGSRLGSGLLSAALVLSLAPMPALADDYEGFDGDAELVAMDAAQAYGGAVSARIDSATQMTIEGLGGYKTTGRGAREYPAMENPTATVTCGNVTYASNAPIAADGTLSISGDIQVGTYTIQVVSDNYQDLILICNYPATQVIEVAGVSYEYFDVATADFSLVGEEAKANALSNVYAQIGETGIYYKPADNQTALAGSLYGMSTADGSETAYSVLYTGLTGMAHDSATYDAISSATGIAGNAHYSQLSTLVSRVIAFDKAALATATDEQKRENRLTGAYATTTSVDAQTYVEATVLEAAGKGDAMTAATVASIKLNGNATTDPASVGDRVDVDTETKTGFFTGWSFFDPTALSTSKAYGHTKLVIRPKAGADGADFSWADYYQHLYAGTIEHNGTTVGMAPWIDLYVEAGHSAVEMSISNGVNPYNGSNKAEVSRYAQFYDKASGRLEAGAYTVTLYAAGYEPLSYTFDIPEVVPSADGSSVELKGITTDKATIVGYSVNTGEGNAAVVGETYATDATVVDGVAKLDEGKTLAAGDYKLTDAAGVVYTFSVKEANTMAVTAKNPKAVTYNASKAQTIANPVAVTDAIGAVTYVKASGAKYVSVAEDGTITLAKGTPAGSYKVTIAAAAAGDETHLSGTAVTEVTIKVNKAAGKLVVKAVKAKQAASAKKATTLKASKVFKVKTNLSKGKVTYKKSSGNKKITVASNGTVKVAKGLKKGTYTVKVTATSAAKGSYKAASASATFKVVVK